MLVHERCGWVSLEAVNLRGGSEADMLVTRCVFWTATCSVNSWFR